MFAVARLALTDFRNHRDAVLEVGEGFVLLSGDNGAGKTNILEAVSLLAPGRGLRGAALSEMARSDGPGGFAVAAELLDPSPRGGEGRVRGLDVGDHSDALDARSARSPSPRPSPRRGEGVQIGTGALPAAPERRQVRINGAPASVNSLSERLAILWLTPAMDRLFSGSAGDRRRFLDRLVLALEPGHAHHASRYEAAMRARNKLLAEAGEADSDWLTALEAQMAEHGAALSDARARTVEALDAALAGSAGEDFPNASLALEGWDGGELEAVLRKGRSRDAAAGRTIIGPHRQDLAVIHRAKHMPASRSSTGEQKALLLGLVLAHAELVADRRGAPAILLLDEVAAHLDPVRRKALFRRLEGRGQLWMTATEPALFETIEGAASSFHVENGTISTA